MNLNRKAFHYFQDESAWRNRLNPETNKPFTALEAIIDCYITPKFKFQALIKLKKEYGYGIKELKELSFEEAKTALEKLKI